MQCFLILSFYLLALILDSMRAFYFSFLMFNSSVLSFYSYIVSSFFSLSPILWFTLIIGEKRYSRNLRSIIMVKFLSILSSFLFLVDMLKKSDASPLSQTMGMYVFFFLCVDFVMLFFSIFREVSLCK